MGALQRKTRSAPRPAARVGRRGLPGALQAHAGLLAVGVVVLVAVLLASATTPSAAQAIAIPNPITAIGNGISSLVGTAVGPIVSLVVKAFDAIINHLFAPIGKLMTVAVVHWLTVIPDFTQGKNVANLEATVAAIAGGLLGAVATLSVIRYWLAGFASGGDSGFAGMEGLVRSIGAALFIASWPYLFKTAIGLTNGLTGALLGGGIRENEIATLIKAALGATVTVSATSGFTQGIGLFLAIAVAVAASLLFLGLMLLKIVLSVSTILLFVGMPLAALIWPVAPWVGRLVGRAFAVCLAVPVLWTLCFAASVAVSVDTLTLGEKGVLNTLLSPLVALVLLYVMVRLPVHLSRLAMLGGVAVGGGFVGRAVSYAAGSQLRDTARQHLPESLGGWTGKQQSQSGSRRTARTAATAAGAAATGGATAGAAAASGAASSTAGAGSAGAGAGTAGAGARLATAGARAAGASGASANGAGAARSAAATGTAADGYIPTKLAQKKASGQAAQGGFENVPMDELHAARFDEELEQARDTAENNPVTADQARAALADLPASTQQRIAQEVSEKGHEGARADALHQATSGQWTEQERDAFRALGAASPEVRGQALGEAKASGWTTTGPSGMPDIVATASDAPASTGDGFGRSGDTSGGGGLGGRLAVWQGPGEAVAGTSGGTSETSGSTTDSGAIYRGDPERERPARRPSNGTGGTSPPLPPAKRRDLLPPADPRDQGGGT